MRKPTLLVKLEDGQIIMMNELVLKKAWFKKGLPSIADMASSYLSSKA
jgi:hypothetical protein